MLRIRLHFVSFQINSCPGQDDLAIGGYDFSLQNSLAFSLFSKKRISLFGTLFDYKIVTSPVKTGFEMLFPTLYIGIIRNLLLAV